MFKKILSITPDFLIRFLGRVQFQFPVLRPLINKAAQRVISGEGVIQRGEGEGLRFDATHCNPGYLTGTSDPEEQSLLVDVLSEGDVFYDLGANAGFYAVIAAREVGPQGHVYAFEPTPELADRIRYNGRLNEFKHLTVVEAAVCNRNGSIEFGSEGFDVQNSIQRAEGENAIEVRAVTLDAWAEKQRPPDVLMMDIEGAELDALRGAKDLIRKHRPFMLIEVHWLGQEFIDFVKQELAPLGYEASTYSGDPLPKDKIDRYHALLVPG
jgi:FkbM family methyltransferase